MICCALRKLRTNTLLTEALTLFWNACTKDSSACISYDEYKTLHLLIYKALHFPSSSSAAAFDEEEALRCVVEDWKKDTHGKSALNKDDFLDAFFNLVDIWYGGDAFALMLSVLMRF